MSDKTIQRIQEATNDSFSYGEPGSLEKKLRIFFLQVEQVLKDKKITLQEVVAVFLCGLRLAVQAVDDLPIEGGRRKILVMGAASRLFDTYAYLACPLLLKPFWFAIKPIVRPIALTAASGAVEFLIPTIRNPYI